MQAGGEPHRYPRIWLAHWAAVGAVHQLGEEVHELTQLFDWGLRALLGGLILCSRRGTLSGSLSAWGWAVPCCGRQC